MPASHRQPSAGVIYRASQRAFGVALGDLVNALQGGPWRMQRESTLSERSAGFLSGLCQEIPDASFHSCARSCYGKMLRNKQIASLVCGPVEL